MKTVLPVLLLLTACATGQPEAQVNLGGYPPAFRAGYIDGCESAKRLAGRTRDEDRFKSDPMYATGWRDGFDICKKGSK
jgi:hypothetical protein